MNNDVTIPILPGIVDLTYLQNAVAFLLLDDPRLANTPVIPEFRLQMTSEGTRDILWMSPRSSFTLTPTGLIVNNNAATGPVGAGLMVEMPNATSDSPAVSGPPLTWDVNITAFEERNVNMTPGVGTLITSEQYAQIILNVLQEQYIAGYGTLQVKNNCITSAHDWMSIYANLVCTRASLKATVGRAQSTRTAPAKPVIAGGTCTITCSDATAAVYYSLDGSMPVKANSGPQNAAGVGAQLYAGPFAVTSGQTVLTAARSATAGTILSPVNGAQAP